MVYIRRSTRYIIIAIQICFIRKFNYSDTVILKSLVVFISNRSTSCNPVRPKWFLLDQIKSPMSCIRGEHLLGFTVLHLTCQIHQQQLLRGCMSQQHLPLFCSLTAEIPMLEQRLEQFTLFFVCSN